MAPVYAAFDPNLEADGENYEGQADHPGFNDRETWIGGLTANWELGDWVLTSVTGYSNYLEEGDIDADGGPMPYITLGAVEDYTQISQEIRVASPPDDIEFVAGLYYFYSETDIATHVGLLPVADPFSDVATILLPDAVNTLLGPAAGPVLAALGQPEGAESADLGFFQTSSSYAAFGQANWHILEDFTLIVGARYTMEEKEVEQSQALNGAGILTGPAVANWEAYTFADTRREYSFSPKLALQYVYDDDIMFYGSVAKGFKGGGYNASASRNEELEYEPENALSFEVGMKSEFLDGAARANVSVFYTEFSDLQVSVFSTTQFVVRNAADAITRGVEFEFMMVPLEGLMLMASGAYTDAYFDSYKQGTCKVGQDPDTPDGNCDLTGQTLQRAPEWTGNFSINYTTPLGSMPFGLVVGTDFLYQDDFFLADDNDPLDAQEAYIQVNARIGIRAEDESWSFMVFGRNLTDEVVKVTAADAPLAEESHFAVFEPPRLISAEFTARF